MVFSPEEVEGLMNDLVFVGPRKPLGCLPISTLQMCGQDMSAVIDNARIKSLRAEMWGSDKCDVGSGAIFVWDAKRIEEFIELNSGLLTAMGWPDDHYMLVRHIATKNVPLDTPLHELIDTLYSGQFYETLSIQCPKDFVPLERGFAGYIWNGSPAEKAMRTRYS